MVVERSIKIRFRCRYPIDDEFNDGNEDGKVLGIVWLPIEDKFKIRLEEPTIGV